MENDLFPNIMKVVFQFRKSLYNQRSEMNSFMTQTVSRPQLCVILSSKKMEASARGCKMLQCIKKFKKLIKSWVSKQCPCRLCKTYSSQVGFIWS